MKTNLYTIKNDQFEVVRRSIQQIFLNLSLHCYYDRKWATSYRTFAAKGLEEVEFLKNVSDICALS